MPLFASVCQMCVLPATENLCSGVGSSIVVIFRVPLARAAHRAHVAEWDGRQLCRACCAYSPDPSCLGWGWGNQFPSLRPPASEPCDTLGRYRVGGVSAPPTTTASRGTWACSQAETRLSPEHLAHLLEVMPGTLGHHSIPSRWFWGWNAQVTSGKTVYSFTAMNRRKKPVIKDKSFNWKPQLRGKFAMPRKRWGCFIVRSVKM